MTLAQHMEKHLTMRNVIFVFAIIFPLINPVRGAAIPLSVNKISAVNKPSAAQMKKERARKKVLKNHGIYNHSNQKKANKNLIQFPTESPCHPIREVIRTEKHASLKLSSLTYATRETQRKCLGINGATLLAHRLQNAIIQPGDITTPVHLPQHDFKSQQYSS